ncbi:MAG: VCBS repeat-containing protein [Ignavibacteria bacterium]|nr:VCBS repeat-containing protein [Ignavibacteria bacterium]
MRSFLTSFALLFLCSAFSLSAQPGQLVPCFNTGMGFNGNTNSFILLPTGKILCAGDFTSYNGTPVNRICRLNADGTLDATFTPGIGANASIDCMAVLPNGQILISGLFTSYNGTPKGRIARLNADGTLDATFATGVGGNAGRILRFAMQADGKIVIGGGFMLTQYDGITINSFARLNADGSLDATFNSGATSGLTGVGTYNLKIQSDGKILLAGDFTAYKNATVPRGLIRINTDGSLDVTFNNGGSGASNYVESMAIQPDGKIVVGLSGTYNGFARNNIARINTDGSLDNAFYPLGPNGVSCNVALQSDGKILVSGSFSTYDGITSNNIARANSDGTIDISFSPGTGTNLASTIGFVLADGTGIIGGYGPGFTTYNGVSATRIARIQLSVPVTISGTSPQRNSNTAALSTPLNLNFTQSMNAATASQSAFRVWGGMSGLRSGTYSGGGSSAISFTPTKPYSPGELVSATLLCGAQSSIGTPTSPHVMQFRAKATGGSGSFPGQALFSPFYLGTPTTPIGIATADFDNDGDADLVTADNFGAAQRVSVLTNNGQATFTVTPYSCTGYNPRAVTTGDVNNDGWQDIIAVDQGGIALIWLNNGSGSFGSVITRTTLIDIVSVTVADIDADGDLDLIVSGNSNGVQILLNNGSGTFGTATSIGGGHTTTTGDVDNDGDIDIISATAGGSVNVYRNNGSGTFASNSYGTGGFNNNNIAVGDLNGDGFLDIATAHDAGISSVAVLLNNGAGSFSAAVGSPFPLALGANPRAIALGDVDGDGDLDIATGNSTSNDVAVLINNGVASFTFATGSPFPVGGNTPWGITMADFDNDGDIDIATPNNQTNNVSILINAPSTLLISTNPARNSNTQTPTSLTLSWSQPMTTATASLPSPASIAHNLYVWGGMSGYRSLPLSGNIGGTATQSGNTTTFMPNAARPFRPGEEVSVTVVNAQATSGVRAKPTVYGFRTKAGTGPATFYQTSTPVVGVDARTTATGDFDGDGDLDLAVGSPSQVDILLNDGTGTFTTGSQILSAALGGLNPWTVTAGDFNNDGSSDLAVTGTGGSSAVYILFNNANGTGTFAVSSNYVTGIGQCWHLTSADIDGDGDLDLLVANTTGTTINILLNNGNGTFTPGTNPTVGSNPRCVAAADLDNDGDIDLAVGNNLGGTVSILLNNGDGTFSAAPNITTAGANPVFVAAGDLDGDGKSDLAVTNSDLNTVQIFKNIGAGNFMSLASYPTFGAFPSPVFVSMADFDGNGTLDLAAVNYGSTDISILLNNGSASFTNAVKYPALSAPNYLAAGDFDGDGDLDLAVTNSGASNLVSVLKNAVQPTLTTLSPARNTSSAPNTSAVSLTYNQNMAPASANVPALNIWGGFSGYKTGGTRAVAGGTVTANVGGFRAGEQVWVTHQSAKSTSSIPAKNFVYGFTAKAGVGPGTFVRKSTSALNFTGIVAVGDVDNDGDLDIAATEGALVEILLNDGKANFTSGGTFTGGPGGCFFADMDNDGDLDLAVVNVTTFPSQITIWRNGGIGNFSMPLGPFNCATDYSVINFGDVNGDGYLDVVAANNNGGNISVLLNNGTGSLAPTIDYSTGGSVPNGIALGDVDNDGDIDVVVTNNGSHTVSVMLNNGQGVFPLPDVSILSGTWVAATNTATPTSVSLGDVNGDGYLDIAVVAEGIAGTGTVDVRLNNGSGGFGNSAPGAPFQVPSPDNSSAMIVLADVDGDGDLDVATGRRTGGALIVRLNSGSGDFSISAVGSPYPTIGGTFGIASGDLDGDGDIDFIAGSEGTPDVNIFLNATQPILTSFSPTRNTQTLQPNAAINLTYNQTMTTATASVQPFRVWGGMRGFRSGTYSQPTGAASAQLTLSPPLLPNEEVFVSVTNAQNANSIAARPLTLQYRAGAGVGPATFFAAAPVQAGTMSSTIRRSVALDYNSDGFVDMAFVNDAANAIQIMQGSASGTFTLGPLVGLGGGTQPSHLAVGDFNSDGRPDMVVSCYVSGTVVVLMNAGGVFTPSSMMFLTPLQITVADFNSDGALDFAVVRDAGFIHVHVYYGANNGSFSAPQQIPVALNFKGLAAADFDNDGRTDLLVMSPGADARLFRNSGLNPGGTATFDAGVVVAGSAALAFPEMAEKGDFNGDGIMDIAAFSANPARLFSVWLGNGAGGFSITNYGSGAATGITTGDFNGDGRLDIAVGDVQGTIQIWMNNGSGSFTQSGIGNGALSSFPIAADIDRDGDLDLLTTDAAMQLVPFLNQPAPTLTASPTTLDFGSVTVGQSSSLSATINGTNLVGAITAGITRATLSAFSYAVNTGISQTQGTVTISGATSLTIPFQTTFTPSTNGIFTTTVTVTSASATPLTLTLTGVAVLPRIPTPPVITALSTNAALIGTPVTVSGLNFTNVSQASIGGISTTVSILSATQANVILPTGLSIGQVVLTNIDGTAISRDSVRALVPYTPPPIVTAVAPLTGAAGEIITVTGANFATGATTVFIGTLQLSATFNSTTRLTIVLPANALGNLIVRTPNGSTTSSFVLRTIPPPAIQSINPAQARNGETFTIFGAHYLNVLSVTAANMRLDSTSWQIDSLAQRLAVRVIENLNADGTIGTITVQTRSGVALFTQRYSAGGVPEGVPQPSIIAALPPNSVATLQEGNEIALLATNIPTGATLTLTVNGITATIASVQNTSGTATLRFRLPVGIVPITLQSTPSLVFSLAIGGIATTATFQLPVQAAFLPTLTTFTPPLGGTCSTVSINGQNLGLEPRGKVTNVLVGGVPVQAFRVVSPTQILATVGTVRSGVVSIVTTVGAISTSAMFSFDPTFQCFPPMRREDSLALDAFYVATVGLDWTTSTNWTVQGVPAAMRFGVKVEGDRVVEIRMPKNNVSGSIPEFVMQNLRTLKALDLGNNRIGGALPQALAQASSLEILRLGQNHFTGTLPQNMAALTRLRELDLSDNLLSDTLGQCWTVTGLESLNLSGNRFTGRISRDVARLANLLTLDLSRNLLSDSIPPEIGTLQQLKSLRLGGNRLTGRIPTTFGTSSTTAKTALLATTPNLTSLDLSNNQLSGMIPAELGTLTNLRELLLNGNTLSGEIPSGLAKLNTLQILDVEQNQLLESPSFTAIPRLTLRLAGNRFDFATIESQVPVRPSAGAQQAILSTPIFSYTSQSPNVRISDRTDTSVALDASLRLRVAARGINNRYSWWKDDVLIQATSPTATLLIPSVAPGDSGSYKCVISNTLLPDLKLTTPPLRVTTFTPAFPPQDSIVLIAPALAAEDISPVPTFVWTSTAGARQYRLEVSGTPSFTTLLASVSVPQTAQALTSGRVEFSAQGTIGFPLASSARIFWRVRAENARGAGNPSSSDFTTAAGDALLTADRLDFGRIPRGDTATRLLTVRNISTQTLRIENLTAASTVFRAGLQRAFTLAPGRDTTVSTGFLPAALGEVQSALTAQFRAIDVNGLPSGALQTQTFQDRLRGRGGALKFIPPVFDTIPVRTTKIVSALLLNVSGSPLEINNLTILRGGEGFTLRAGGIQRVEMAASDTLVIPVSCSTEQANRYLRDTLRVQTTLERIDAPLEAFSRNRTPKDVAVNLGIRPQQNNLPPGSGVTMEIFIIPTGNTTLDSVFNAANPFIKAIIRADKNVLALSPNETFVRMQQLDTNRMIRFIVPATTWNPRTNVVAQFQCVVVAGNTDYTALKIEDVQWGTGNVILDTVLDSSFTARTSRAGGKRLISSGGTTQLTAIAPNPAKDEIEITYTLAESDLVSITLLDARGNETLGVLNEVQTAGKHTLRVKVGWLASGMYHVRLRTNNETTTQQVNIVK